MSEEIIKIEISTLEEVTSYLSELQKGASHSLESTIKAQMEVIRFVQSPTLVGTTFDSLILFLKRSVDEAETDREKNNLRDHFSLMIQNYIFFFNARLQLEINSNKEEATKLFHQAGELLSKSITDISLMAIPAGQAKGIKSASIVVKNFFSKDDNGNNGFLTRLINWWRKDKVIAEKKREFYVTLNSMFFKLGKHSSLIGPSFLINGVILNYVTELSNYNYNYELYSIEDRIKKYKLQLKEQPILFSNIGAVGITLGIGVVTIVLRWIWDLISAVGTAVVDVFSDEKSVTSNESWFLQHVLVVLLITAIVETYFVLISLSKRKGLKHEINKCENEYNKVLKEKKEYIGQLKEIAEKFEE